MITKRAIEIARDIHNDDPGHRGTGQGAEKRQKRRPGGNAPLVDRRIYLRRIRP